MPEIARREVRLDLAADEAREELRMTMARPQ
jgi:hypothetical protein